MNGVLIVKSKLGEGSVFEFIFFLFVLEEFGDKLSCCVKVFLEDKMKFRGMYVVFVDSNIV